MSRSEVPKIDGVLIGRFEGFDEDGQPLVSVPGLRDAGSVSARTTAALAISEIGREVALLFEGGDPTLPIVLGVIRHPLQDALVSRSAAVAGKQRAQGVPVHLEAKEELVLRCGRATITLREDGKIVIQGVDVMSRAARTNKIKGGSVQIN